MHGIGMWPQAVVDLRDGEQKTKKATTMVISISHEHSAMNP